MILIKARSAINIAKVDDYKKKDLHTYQCFIGKLMYLTYKTKLNIAFTVS